MWYLRTARAAITHGETIMFGYKTNNPITAKRSCNVSHKILCNMMLLLGGNAVAGDINLAWDTPASTTPAGYKVYYGRSSGNYISSVDVGNKTSYKLSGLQNGVTYYFAVTDYDSARTLESGFSNEVSATVPTSAPSPQPTPSATPIPFPVATPTPVPTVPSTGVCPCTIWPSTSTPTYPNANDGEPLELGFKFRSDTPGYITGIRFYKGAGNTGTHVGHLWSASGLMLAEATFVSETTSGWQQVNFATPVAINANSEYIASYFSPNGGFSVDWGYFANGGVASAPLYALGNGVSGGNGLYVYGATGGFPNNSFNAGNYWVDVVFADTLDTGYTPPKPTPSPVPTATPKPSASPKPTPTPTATPKPSASPTPTPTASPKPTATPAPTAEPSPPPQSCNGVPTLDSIPSPQAVHVGQNLTFYVTALDCDGDRVSIRAEGKPKGATFVQSYNSAFQKQMGKFVFMPSASQANRSFVVTFTARESLGHKTYGQSSLPQAVYINVLPELAYSGTSTASGSENATSSASTEPTKVNIATAKYRKSKQAIEVEGLVVAKKSATQADRILAFSKDIALVDSLAGTQLGTTNADTKTGKFKALVPANKSVCAIEAQVSSVRGKPKVVKGLAGCN